MDCIDVLVRMSDIVSGRLSGTDQEAVRRHLHECPSCAAVAKFRLRNVQRSALWEEESGSAALEPVPPGTAQLQPQPAAPRTERSSIITRILQVCTLLLLCAIGYVLARTHGNLDQLLGLERWRSEHEVVTEHPEPAPQQPVPDKTVDLLHETTELLGVIQFSGTTGAETSTRIIEARLAARLREQGDRSDLPAWTAAVFAKLETFFLRAAAAGVNAEEWADLGTIATDERLMLLSEDVRAYLKSPEKPREP